MGKINKWINNASMIIITIIILIKILKILKIMTIKLTAAVIIQEQQR